jgi:hypothetical protein
MVHSNQSTDNWTYCLEIPAGRSTVLLENCTNLWIIIFDLRNQRIDGVRYTIPAGPFQETLAVLCSVTSIQNIKKNTFTPSRMCCACWWGFSFAQILTDISNVYSFLKIILLYPTKYEQVYTTCDAANCHHQRCRAISKICTVKLKLFLCFS